ncbi:hypothetical protein DSL72_000369 [Monilinia vaccinii-corymbosi]|uniref:MvcIVH1_02422 n=1 Tax=Monilinia vaccinii-corymbosi TaxID=61207 RepID=A0A897Q0T7_9HELO|nr:MvcIVH1_02422 [Monilinia vaccinii-corymbosi]QSZ30811.1 hypothetical protein DSL72_000369 [Monilinia vaccinii-corymbosi]
MANREARVGLATRSTFKRHVAERTTKATKVARHIKGLAGVKFGPPAASLRKAVITYVQPFLLYGSEVWYREKLKPSLASGFNYNRTNGTRRPPSLVHNTYNKRAPGCRTAVRRRRTGTRSRSLCATATDAGPGTPFGATTRSAGLALAMSDETAACRRTDPTNPSASTGQATLFI